MAEMLLPLAALAGFASAAPQLGGLNLGLGANANAAATVAATAAVPSVSASRAALGGQPLIPATSSVLAAASSAAAGLPVSVPVVGGVAGSLPVSVPNVGGIAGGLPVSIPDVGGVAGSLPTSNLPLTLPAILETALPTTAITKVIPTTVPLVNTAIISSLATLPENAAVTPIISSALANLPTTGLPTAAIPTSILPGNLPVIPSGLDINAIIDDLGDQVFGQVASKLADVFETIASAAGTNLPVANTALPSNLLDVLTALPTGGVAGALPTEVVGVPNITLPGGRAKDDVATSEGESSESNEKRQAALTGLLGGATGGSSPVSGVVSTVGGLAGADLLSGLTSSGSPLTAIGSLAGSLTGGSSPLSVLGPVVGGTALSALPLGTITNPLANVGSITAPVSDLGLGSIVLNTVQVIPLPANLPDIINGIKTAALAPLTSILANTPFASQISAVLAILNTLSSLNPGALGSLASLTNLSSLQSAVLLLNTPDLATIIQLLSNGSLIQLPSAKKRAAEAAAAGSPIVLDSLLASPASMVSFVNIIQPLVSNLPASVSYVILSQIGATNLQNIIPGVDTSAVTSILGKLPLSTLTSALPVKE